MTTRQSIGDRLVAVFTAPPFNLTRKQFAAKIGVSTETLRRWTKDAIRPNASTLERIREVLGAGATAEWVLFGSGPGPMIEQGQSALGAAAVPRPIGSTVPFLAWTRVYMVELQNGDRGLKDCPRVAGFPELTERTKVVEVPDDSMAPVLHRGDRVQVEPGMPPAPGDLVLVIDRAGAFFLREFRQRPYGFDAHAFNPAHSPMESARDGLAVVAVATHHTRPLRRTG